MLIQTSVKVEDCNYYNPNEVSRTSTNGNTLYDNKLTQPIPDKCEISYELWSNNSLTGSEHRFFIMPKSQYYSTPTQPTEGLFIDQYGSNRGRNGKRENNNTIDFPQLSMTTSQWHTIKYIRDGTTVKIYLDDVLQTTQTINWIDNYSDYTMTMMRWSASGTSKMRNVKFKTL